MWVTSKPLGKEDVLKAMKKAVPNFDQHLKNGQIEILPHTQWYLKGGKFDSKRVLNGWVNRCDQALAKGYEGLRLTGNTFWLEKKDWRKFTDYEEEVNNLIGRYRMIAICTYSLDKCGTNEVIDVISNHQLTLIKREGKWNLIVSSERRRAEESLEALRENEKDLNHAQAVAHTGSWRLGILRNEPLWSDETHHIFGIPKETPLAYEAFLATAHPEDRQFVDQSWRAALRGQPYDIEHRIVVERNVK
jgi:hypothetical protein